MRKLLFLLLLFWALMFGYMLNAEDDCGASARGDAEKADADGRGTVWENHPVGVGILGAALLLTLGAGFAWYCLHLRNIKRLMIVFKASPSRSAVIDARGNILFMRGYYSEDGLPIKNFAGFPQEIQNALEGPVKSVLETGNPVNIEYNCSGRRRHAEIVRLDKSVFGVETALVTSVDVDELHNLSERFRQTLKSISDCVVSVDASQRITLANRTAAQLLGLSRDELAGAGVDDVVRLSDGSSLGLMESPVRRAMESGEPVELPENTELECAGGLRRNVACTVSPIKDDAGAVSGAVLVLKDVTAQISQRRELMEAQNLLRLTMNSLPCFFWIKDCDDGYRYILANDNYRDAMLGAGEDRIEGKTDFDLHVRAFAEKYRSDDMRIMESGKRGDLYEEYAGKDGMRRSIHTIKVPLPDYKNGRRLLLGMSFDITEIVDKRNLLQDANLLLQAIQDNLPCAFFVKDADDDYRYVMCNRSYADFLSTTCDDIRGKSDSDLYPNPENVRSCRASDILAIEEGYSDGDETVSMHGKQHILRCIKSRLIREDGRRLLLGICVDISKERGLQEELRGAMDVLKVYVEQEHLLNQCLESVLLDEGEDSAIQIVMKMIGERLKADHAYCFRYDYSGNKIIPIQEWARDGREERLEDIPRMSIDEGEGWFKLFKDRKILNLPDVSTNAAKAVHGRWAQLMPKIGVRSLYAVSVWCDKELWGHIGLSYTEPKSEISEPENDLLQSCAHIVEMILERRKNRTELERSEYEKLLIMDSIRIPIMLFNPDMKLIRCNNAALEIAGIPETQAYAGDCWKSFCCGDCRPKDCPVGAVAKTRAESRCEMRIKGRDYLMNAYPIMMDGGLVYIMKTMIDITELNAAKQKLAAALDDARNASKAKSYFLATMSHELRTPLNAVIGFSELLQTGKLPQDEHDDYLHSINLAGNSLLMLVNDVLDLSKLEAGQMVLTPQVTDLRKVLDEMRSVFQYKIKQKKLSLAVECPEGVPLLKLDSLRLRQIMLNLIGNAVKFTENGGIDIFVNFKRAPEGKVDISVGVRDTGMGIPEDEREKIFASFVQSRALRDTHAYNGTGLGLAISRRLAMQMGGCISLESEVGRGSCFRLELGGIEEAEPAAVEIMESAHEAAIFPEEIRMLIVDDVPMNLKVLQAMLRKLGIESVCAGSGAEAIEILKSDKNFKYVLTDLWMPEMDGVEFAKELKRMSGCENISVMAVTADTEMKQNFDMGAFSGMLLKPVTIDSIRGMVFGVPGAQ